MKERDLRPGRSPQENPLSPQENPLSPQENHLVKKQLQRQENHNQRLKTPEFQENQESE